jgi:cytochrome c5
MMSRLDLASIRAWRVLGLACLAAVCLTGCPVEEPVGPDAGPEDAFTQFYQSVGSTCAGCHAPGAPGGMPGTEETQDWSSEESARDALLGTASGLIGNFAGCNGVPFIGGSVDSSLIVAAFDSQVRADFSLTEFPDCTADSISDMTLKIGRQLTADERSLLDELVMDVIAVRGAAAYVAPAQ